MRLPPHTTLNADSSIVCNKTLVGWWLFPCLARMQEFRENVRSFNPCLHFFFFFFEVEISSCPLIPLSLCQDQSTMAQQAEMTVAKCSLTSCMSSSPDRIQHHAWTTAQSAHSNFIGSRVYACLDVTCNLHFWQNDQGLSCAAAVRQEWNEH